MYREMRYPSLFFDSLHSITRVYCRRNQIKRSDRFDLLFLVSKSTTNLRAASISRPFRFVQSSCQLADRLSTELR